MKQNWEIKKLSEIGKVFNGNSINEKVKKDNYTGLDEGLPFIATKDVGFDSIIDYENGVKIPFTEKEQFKIAPANTPLICAEGGSAGRKIGFTNQDVCFGNKLFALVSYKNVDSKFLFYYYFSSSFQKYFSTEMTGIIGGVSMNKFKDIEIPLPPLPEQQRIVSILDEAFAAIAKAKANTEQNLKNAKELFENSLQSIFTVKGNDWNEKLLGELATFRNGINYTKGSKGEKIQIVGVKDFQNSFWVPTDDLDEVVIDGKLNETDRLQDGDILAVRSNGNPQLIGRTLLAGNIQGQVSHSGFTIRIRLNSKSVLPNYLCRYMKTQKTRKELVESGNGVGIKSLNQGSLSSLKIPFPTSVKEQEKIIEKLDLISEQSQRLENIYLQKLNNLEELKKSILQKAFAGELKTKVIQNILV
jgi:type I restriction enzyme S subunit